MPLSAEIELILYAGNRGAIVHSSFTKQSLSNLSWSDRQTRVTRVTEIAPGQTSLRWAQGSENVGKRMGFSRLCAIRTSLWRERSIDDGRHLVHDHGGHHPRPSARIHQHIHRQTLRLRLLFCHLDVGKPSRSSLFQDTQSMETDISRECKVTGLAAQYLLTIGCSYGLGNHLALFTENQLILARKWGWITQMVCILGFGFDKLAVIAFLFRIDERTNSKRFCFLYFVGFSNIVLNANQSTLMGTVCSPLAKWWDATVPGVCPKYHLLRTYNVGYFQGSLFGSWSLLHVGRNPDDA